MTEIFWISLLFIVYTYLGYPLIIAIWARLKPRNVQKGKCVPTVTILIAAHNEEAVIEEKIKNCLSIDYPQNKYEIIIASDGSQDKTNTIVRQFKDPRVRLVPYDDNDGKTKTLNKTIPLIKNEIIVFTDASEMMEAQAVTNIVANFDDASVGCVSGELYFHDPSAPTSMSRGVSLYWSYEKFLRRCESKVDSMMGATGAFYALRRELYIPPPDHTILDDMAIPFGCILKGYRAVFDPGAKIYERISESFDEEFFRKVRTQAGVYELAADRPTLLFPGKNRLWFQLWSHKIFRLFVPYFLILLFTANCFMSGEAYKMFLFLQIAFYALALIGAVLASRKIHTKLTGFAYAICVLNLAALISPHYFIRHRKRGAWTRTKI